MSILSKLAKVGAGNTHAQLMSESDVFMQRDTIPTKLPILNIAFSGEVVGGLSTGITVIAGPSKTFKSMISLYCMKAYFDKYHDACAIFYDTEMGITNSYLQSFGIDPSRVLHIPVDHVEQLKFDMTKKLEEIKRGDHVFFLIDSIGQIASKKETDDALDEKTVADMSRAKALRSLMRLIAIQLARKDIPCIAINHVYQTQELYSKTIVSGGTSQVYSANTVFIMGKSQEKASDGELEGWNYTINIEKSRFIREKSKLTFTVDYEKGIKTYSGILDLALEGKFVGKPSNGWYQLIDESTGELVGQKVRASDTETKDFLGKVLLNPNFREFVKSKYKLSMPAMTTLEEDLENV